MRASSAPEKILHRIWPLLVTVEITLRLDRLFLIRSTGVCPFGA
jgi:hypothetical protein